jgi:phosphopantothenoylcysteine decarboxylase/phosphopantothenate--cysteine ligase
LTVTTSIELHEMPKRQLADRILDEIVALRRPRSLVLEFDEHVDEKPQQDEALKQAVSASASRRELIVE